MADKKVLGESGTQKIVDLIKNVLPEDGITGQVLTKTLTGVEWKNPTGGSGDGSYDDTLLRQWVANNYVNKDVLEAYEKIEDLMQKLSALKSEILGGAGQDYDTLKEIETWIKEHQDLYQALISTVGTKASTEYVNDELQKLLAEINKKCNVHICDNQYEFDQILTKDNNTIYLIKGDQDTWFSKEDGNELWDNYGLLLERVRILERLAGLAEYEPGTEEGGPKE